MIATYIADFRKAVSAPRLDKYRPSGGSDLDMAVDYLWNVALSEALYPSQAALEVTLRCSIHDALTAREGTDMWFRNLLEPGQLRDYANSHMHLLRRKKLNPTAGQIVAELSFGFWTTLLSQPYHQRLWAPNRAAMLHSVFPHLPPTPNARQYVHQRYNVLRLLRNRMMHHEPILYGVVYDKRNHPIVNLHSDTLQAIGWISPTVRDSVKRIDRFDDIYANGQAWIEAEIKAQLNFP